jgi:hypothetical protein
MTLPDHLPAEAALALYDLLGDWQQALWEKYQPRLLALCWDELRHDSQVQTLDHEALPTDEDFDDQLPLF